MAELQAAGSRVYSELKNLVVWAKTNGGMGTFYRSRHELIYVWKVGTAPHTNTFGLGETGRYRTNVWDGPGVNSFGANQKDLALHPTVKPVALVADAIKDVTRRGEIVLDGFGGSGTTLIAAERTTATGQTDLMRMYLTPSVSRVTIGCVQRANAQVAFIRPSR